MLTPRTVVKPLSVNTTSSKSIAASPTCTASPSARPKSGSPSPSSTAHHRRTSSGSAGKNGSDNGGIFIGMFYITIMYRDFCSHFTTMCVISKGRIPARATLLLYPSMCPGPAICVTYSTTGKASINVTPFSYVPIHISSCRQACLDFYRFYISRRILCFQ